MVRKLTPDHGEAVVIPVSGETVIYEPKYRGMKEVSRHADRNGSRYSILPNSLDHCYDNL